MSSQFLDHFSELEDPRIERCRKHELLDIIFLSVCAVLSGADGWESIEEFGEAKLEWLRKFVPMKHGIPSHDTIARVMSRLNPEALQRCFIGWVQAVVALHSGEIVAIDGKTLRHSFDPMFPTSADAAQDRAAPGQCLGLQQRSGSRSGSHGREVE